MPSVAATKSPQLGDTVLDGLSAPNGAAQSISFSAAATSNNDSDMQKAISAKEHDIVGDNDGVSTHRASVAPYDPALSAVQPKDGESEEEIGAFDDSHLQVDQEKKKGKKKSKKRKPKSKRGLVWSLFSELKSAD